MKPKLPKLQLKLVSKTLLNVFLVVLIFLAGYTFGYKGYVANFNPYPNVTIDRTLPSDKNLDFSLFWKVWDTIGENYFDKTKIIPAKLVYGSIQGMVAAVGDPYTVFLPPTENKVVQEDLQGSFDGVGIQIGFKGTRLAVVAPLPGSPAEKVGIKAGDLIVGIKDDKKGIDMGTVGINLPDAVQAIRGPKGSKVTLYLTRDGSDQVIETEVQRDSIDVPSVVLSYVGENSDIARIQVLKFVEETQPEWDKAVIDILKNANTKGIIIDLRNNPGGYMQGAVDLATDFLEVGEIVVSEEDGNGQKQDFKVEKLGRLRNEKLVVLINGGSASASEIFAGALRDAKKVRLIGETSFGKGTIQESQQINGGAGLHITIAKWLTPSGYWVNEQGLKPDVEVKDDAETSEDEQLQEAISSLQNF
jgi:carboxyl-terminal processing protease